jgi:hypothetical protein
MPIRALKSVVLSGLRMAGYELVKAQPYSRPAPFPEPVAPPATIPTRNSTFPFMAADLALSCRRSSYWDQLAETRLTSPEPMSVLCLPALSCLFSCAAGFPRCNFGKAHQE